MSPLEHLWLVFLAFHIKCIRPQNVTISTNLGDVTGSVTAGVNVFSDIPYTEIAPIGNFRWTPMSVKTSNYSSNPLMATSSSQCVQYGSGGVEDCLKLNIYTTDTNANMAVTVWIHGGAFMWGSGYLYDGTQFALNGMVYVSINYRLGVFGFLPLNEIYLENNLTNGGLFGIHDQIIALQWIKQNIADYGGDPTKIEIFGESAGGLSVCALLFSPIANNLFNKAIIQSGACNGPWRCLPKNWQYYHDLSNTTLATLRNKSVSELQYIGPIRAVDGYVLTNDNILSTTTALNADKVLIGVNSLDTLYMKWPLPNGSPTTVNQLKHYINGYFNVTGDALYNTLTTNYYKLTDFEGYTALGTTYNKYGILWVTINADACLICPTFYLSNWLYSQTQNNPDIFNGSTYTYHFLGADPPYYSPHFDEIGYVFNMGLEEANLSNITHTAWINFGTDTSDDNLEPYINATQKATIFGGVNTVEIIEDYFRSNYRGGVCKWWETQSDTIKYNMCFQTQPITIPTSNPSAMPTSDPSAMPTASPTPKPTPIKRETLIYEPETPEFETQPSSYGVIIALLVIVCCIIFGCFFWYSREEKQHSYGRMLVETVAVELEAAEVAGGAAVPMTAVVNK